MVNKEDSSNNTEDYYKSIISKINKLKDQIIEDNLNKNIETLKDVSLQYEEQVKSTDPKYNNSKSGLLLKELMKFEEDDIDISSIIDLKDGLAIANAFKKQFPEEIFNVYSLNIIKTVLESIRNIFGVPRSDIAKKLCMEYKIVNPIPRVESILITLKGEGSLFIKTINDIAFLSTIIPERSRTSIGYIKLYAKVLEKNISNILYSK
jgi:hypothetical protein